MMAGAKYKGPCFHEFDSGEIGLVHLLKEVMIRLMEG